LFWTAGADGVAAGMRGAKLERGVRGLPTSPAGPAEDAPPPDAADARGGGAGLGEDEADGDVSAFAFARAVRAGDAAWRVGLAGAAGEVSASCSWVASSVASSSWGCFSRSTSQ